jgi:hypothetical protein
VPDSSGAIELGGGNKSGGGQFDEIGEPLSARIRQAYVDRIKSNHVLTFAGLQLISVEVFGAHGHLPAGVADGIFFIRFIARGLLLGGANNVSCQTILGNYLQPENEIDLVIAALANGLRDNRRAQGGQLNGSTGS